MKGAWAREGLVIGGKGGKSCGWRDGEDVSVVAGAGGEWEEGKFCVGCEACPLFNTFEVASSPAVVTSVGEDCSCTECRLIFFGAVPGGGVFWLRFSGAESVCLALVESQRGNGNMSCLDCTLEDFFCFLADGTPVVSSLFRLVAIVYDDGKMTHSK